MKRTSKITALLLSMMLVMSALAACGGSGTGDSVSIDNTGANAEANDGMQGIVYAVPEGWNLTEVEPGDYATYKKGGVPFHISVSATTQDMLKEAEGEAKNMSIDEYYKKFYVPNKKNMKKYNYEASEIKVCDVDGYAIIRNHNDKIISKEVDWMFEDAVYVINIWNGTMEFDDNGEISNDPEELSEEVTAAFDYLVSSVKQGDGNAMQNTSPSIDFIGDMHFDAPEGYKVKENFDGYITMNKDGGETFISISRETEESLKQWEGENVPKTLKEYYEQSLYEDIGKTKIAGYDGYLDIDSYNAENGELFQISAGFMTEDSVYQIYMDAAEDIWDDDGNVIKGIKPLTDDDIATFKALVNSFKKQ